MCNQACISFAESYLSGVEVAGKRIIEVGSLDVNGSLRNSIGRLQPEIYLGIDISDGPGVDEICDANSLIDRYGEESFDVVISTELLEHVRDWRNAVSNFKGILKPDGIMIITTRSKGFGYHGYPFDFWRYELDDMKAIFSDFSLDLLENDPLEPGVFVKASKPRLFSENSLDDYKLYSIIKKNRCRDISESRFLLFKAGFWMRKVLARMMPSGLKASIKRAASRM